MARLIAVLLVFSTASLLIADAQCNTLCTAKQSAGCHHHSGPAGGPRCVHQQGLPCAWLLASVQIAAHPLVAVAALFPTLPLLAKPSRERPIFIAIADQPSEPPPHTALRI
jgi:hypothetical protein